MRSCGVHASSDQSCFGSTRDTQTISGRWFYIMVDQCRNVFPFNLCALLLYTFLLCLLTGVILNYLSQKINVLIHVFIYILKVNLSLMHPFAVFV